MRYTLKSKRASGMRLGTGEVPFRLEVEGLDLVRGGHKIFSGFEWSAEPETINWVLGENGTGKSSLLATLAGRVSHQAGTIRYPFSGPVAENVIYYEPTMQLPRRLRVGDWLRFMEGVTTHSHRNRIQHLLPAETNPVHGAEALSTGEAKRLLLVTLLSKGRPLLILDEPFEHLSTRARETLYEHLAFRADESLVIVSTNQTIPSDLVKSGRTLYLTANGEVAIE